MEVPRLTIGIEEEFQIIDAEGQLKSHSETLLAAARPTLGEQVKPEMMQSVIEAGTKICDNVTEAREEITRLRGTLAAHLEPHGLRLASAGTHPFSHWQEQEITEHERYGVAFLRRAWLNVDLIWTIALLGAALVTLFT